MEILAIVVGFFFSVIYTTEAIGFYLRGVGNKYGLPSLGYSLHIQFSVLSRTFALFALPMIGFMLDSRVDVKTILIIPISCSIFFVFLFYFLYFKNISESLTEWLFCVYLKKFHNKYQSPIDVSENREKISVQQQSRIFVSSGLAFFIISFGTFAVFIAASIFPAYRASILQSTTLFTGVGTYISTFYLDPKVSTLIDSGLEYAPIVKAVYLSRLISLIFTLLICLVIAWQFK